MHEVTIGYNGGTVAVMDGSGTKTLETAGTYCPGNITVSCLDPREDLAPFRDVNFFDYDGRLLYSYTAAQFAALDALPENPANAGLTAQGWNWTLARAKAFVAAYGGLDIGQSYVTASGNTEIDIDLLAGRTSPRMDLALNGEVEIDWGDGSGKSTLTGADESTLVSASHAYPSAGGCYTILIRAVSGSYRIKGDGTAGSHLLWAGAGEENSVNRAYQSAIRRVRLGTGVSTLDTDAFENCMALETLTVPLNVTNMSGNFFTWRCVSLRHLTVPVTCRSNVKLYQNYALRSVCLPYDTWVLAQDCYSLRRVLLPDAGQPEFQQAAFRNCQSMSVFIVPGSFTSIRKNAFQNCCSLSGLHFRRTSPPVAENANVFENLPADCVIYVPAGSLSAYTGATNYPDPSIYTYVEE